MEREFVQAHSTSEQSCRHSQMGVMSAQPAKANHCTDLQAGCTSLKWVGVEAITLSGPTPVTISTATNATKPCTNKL